MRSGGRLAQAVSGPRRLSWRTAVAAAVAAPWAAWAVVRGFGLESGHPLVPAMAFTPFVAASAWLPLLVAALLRRWAVAVVALAAAVALGAAVLPRALPGPRPQVRDGVEVTFMTANLAYGRADAAAVMRLVRRHDVDVLALEELTPGAAAALDAAGARTRFPERVLDVRPGARGSGLMSRFALRGGRRPRDTRMAMPEARLEVPGAAGVMLKVVHPPAPLRADVGVWESELGGLPRAVPGGPLRMLIGDFNATLDHERMRELLASGYVDAADAAGTGLRGTYRAGRRLPPPVAIDHVLVDRRVRVERVTVSDQPGGDHRALIAAVVLPQR